MNLKKNTNNNTYYFSISLGIDPVTGKRRQTMRSGFKTKKEAEQEYNRLRNQYFNGKLEQKNTDISFTQLITMYSEIRQTQIKRTTFQGEQSKISIHIEPYFRKAKLHKIQRKDVVTFQSFLVAKGLSHNSINKILLTLKKLFDFAIDQGMMTTNHCISVQSLRVEKTEMSFWTLDDFKKFIAYIRNHEERLYEVFFTLAYMTGARLSELLGCQWNDINFNNSTWRIKHSLHYTQKDGYFLDTPKTTSSNRTIALNKATAELLQNYKKSCNSIFVFGIGNEFPQRTIMLKRFYTCIKLAEVPKIRFHDLRHSYVALLIDMQEQDFVIKERMGHSSIRVTYDIYGHLFPTRQHELAERLDNLF